MGSYIESMKKQFLRYKGLAEKAAAQLNDAQYFWTYNDECNSVAVLMKHISGNLISRFTDFFTTDGEKPWRNRDGEFDVTGQTRADIMKQWDKGWGILTNLLDSLKEEDLEKKVLIKKESRTVTDNLAGALAHYADHCGQIIYVSKMQKHSTWNTLSIPRKK